MPKIINYPSEIVCTTNEIFEYAVSIDLEGQDGTYMTARLSKSENYSETPDAFSEQVGTGYSTIGVDGYPYNTNKFIAGSNPHQGTYYLQAFSDASLGFNSRPVLVTIVRGPRPEPPTGPNRP